MDENIETAEAIETKSAKSYFFPKLFLVIVLLGGSGYMLISHTDLVSEKNVTQIQNVIDTYAPKAKETTREILEKISPPEEKPDSPVQSAPPESTTSAKPGSPMMPPAIPVIPQPESAGQKPTAPAQAQSDRIARSAHESIVAGLRKTIRENEQTITDLKTALESAHQKHSSMQSRLASLSRPESEFVVECGDMRVGKWTLSDACKKKTADALKSIARKHPNRIVWEVIPIVDETPYRGMSPELKQEGLGAFRARSAIATLEKTLGKNETTFKGLTLYDSQKRGFRLVLHYLKIPTV